MNALVSFILVAAFSVIPFLLHLGGMEKLLGIYIPYAACAVFAIGIIYRIFKWASIPVPFRIPLTGGQQKSLKGIKNSSFDNPSSLFGVWVRMFLEIFFFRSLFRNTKVEIHENNRIIQGSSKWLWIFSLMFHWSMAIVVIRHLRFVFEPVPGFILFIQKLDGVFETAVPVVYITGILLFISVSFLAARRAYVPQIKQISHLQDYFPLDLIIAIATTGILMRHVFKVDVTAVKSLVLGLVNFTPQLPQNIGAMFYIHFFLICVLLVYIPFSKLMHFAGVLMSPTRNMINNSRAKRHINPWNPEVKTHSYEEWEKEFSEQLKQAGLEKEESHE